MNELQTQTDQLLKVLNVLQHGSDVICIALGVIMILLLYICIITTIKR